MGQFCRYTALDIDLRQFLAFFICGLPGLVDYAVLCLYHAGAVSRPTRRRVTRLLSVWLRAPGPSERTPPGELPPLLA